MAPRAAIVLLTLAVAYLVWERFLTQPPLARPAQTGRTYQPGPSVPADKAASIALETDQTALTIAVSVASAPDQRCCARNCSVAARQE